MPKATAKASTVAMPPPEPSDKSERPVHVIQFGMARVRIWKTMAENHAVYTTTVDRCWRDKAGNETSETIFQDADLFSLAKAITEARRWIEWQQRR